MRKLSLVAMISAILYIVLGMGILVFQDLFKPLFLGGGADSIAVYPAGALIQLACVGLPCAVLGAVNLTGSHNGSRLLPLGTAVYSGIVLGFQSLLKTLLNNISTAFAAHLGGTIHLANMSVLIQLFGWIELFSNIALVLLLVDGVIATYKDKNA